MAFQAKRKFKRSIQREAVRLQTPSGLEYATFEDLSAGGLKLWSDHEMDAGILIEMEFSIEKTKVKSVGKVVRSIRKNDGFEIGVQFVDLQPSTRLFLEKLVDGEDGPF